MSTCIVYLVVIYPFVFVSVSQFLALNQIQSQHLPVPWITCQKEFSWLWIPVHDTSQHWVKQYNCSALNIQLNDTSEQFVVVCCLILHFVIFANRVNTPVAHGGRSVRISFCWLEVLHNSLLPERRRWKGQWKGQERGRCVAYPSWLIAFASHLHVWCM